MRSSTCEPVGTRPERDFEPQNRDENPLTLTVLRKSIHRRTILSAYWPFEARGKEEGHELEDWLRAEEEIRGRKTNAIPA